MYLTPNRFKKYPFAVWFIGPLWGILDTKADPPCIVQEFDTEDEAWEHTREWLVEEMGGTEIEQVAVAAMTDEQVWDTIMDYDYIAFADIAVKKVLY
jgi:hypothetical protein